MKYLITGCSGFIGSNLALRLAGLGEDVWGVDSLFGDHDVSLRRDSTRRLGERNVAFYQLDLARDPLGLLAEDWDYVVHCAGLPAYLPHYSEGAFRACNVLSTRRLLECLESWEKPTRLIHLSSASVLGSCALGDESTPPRPDSPYGRSKYEAEQLVREAGRRGRVACVVLRLFSVYGERERQDMLFPSLLAATRWERPFHLHGGACDHVRDFVHVEDVCAAILKVIGNWEVAEGEVFHIGSGRETIVGDGIDLACRVFGARPRMRTVAAREGDQAYAVARIAKARELLGWQPSVSLEEGLHRLKGFSAAGWY